MSTPAFTYSGDPQVSKRDEVRFLLQDINEARPLISDPELDYLIDFYAPRYDDSALAVAAVAAGVIARKFAGVVSISADGVSVSVGDISQRYTDMASHLRSEYERSNAMGGLVGIENLMWDSELDSTIAPLDFSVGMHDNPAAGTQARGGHTNGPGWDPDARRWV